MARLGALDGQRVHSWSSRLHHCLNIAKRNAREPRTQLPLSTAAFWLAREPKRVRREVRGLVLIDIDRARYSTLPQRDEQENDHQRLW